ncbi:hypothetical protein DFQ05_1019 [Winogradskyella wandonensis]|uniref:DUF4145 domain-containing protein n=2 Tax=Winogradskyella wandonensis TaxID=1442586 RepID=A0A4R1KQB6_9FLAO|nr:hypothetical protein DFQ05_1019 [Winogradskyella wandonensis]
MFWLVIAVLGLLIAWLFNDKHNRAIKTDRIIKKLRKDNYDTKKAYLSLLEKYLKTQQNVDLGIIAELEKLKTSIDTLDFTVHIELETVISNLNEGRTTEAVRVLAKVVENKLKEKANKDESFKGKPMLHNLLEHAKKCSWITLRQFENAMLLKVIRNKESHDLAVQEETKTLGLTIFSGIDLIYALK